MFSHDKPYCILHGMNTEILETIGLSPGLARAYKALIEHGECTAPELAPHIHESRTNVYKLLDRLCELGVATKSTASTKTTYTPLSPAALEQLTQKRIEEAELHKRSLQAAMPAMLDFFFAHSEQPSIRYFQGTDGLRELYKDQLKSNADVYYIRSLDDVRFFGGPDAHMLRNLFPINGIRRFGITQDVVPASYPPEERIPIAESDKLMMLERTWIATDDYKEPVEWAVYGNKLAIISYGEEAIGLIIESRQIAHAFLQLWKLMDRTIRSQPGYSSLPHHTLYTKSPVSMKLAKKYYIMI